MMLENLFDVTLKFLTELQHSVQGGTAVRKGAIERGRTEQTQSNSSAVEPWWPCTYPHWPHKQKFEPLLVQVLAEHPAIVQNLLRGCYKTLVHSPPCVPWEAVLRCFLSLPGFWWGLGLPACPPQIRAVACKAAHLTSRFGCAIAGCPASRTA